MLFSFQAFAHQCREFFSFVPRDVDNFPINDIHAGQSSVGIDYAMYKALRDAGLNTSTEWTTLTARQKEKIVESLQKELSYRVPVIIDPQGRVFAVDQHHDMFALLAVLGQRANPRVPLRILRDFSKESLTPEEFKAIVRKQGWIYERNLDEVLGEPISIRDLVNSVERSVIGMAFVAISSKEGISLKGKYFSPFIQFLIADFMTDRGLMRFSSVYKTEETQKAAALISGNRSLRAFLRKHLVESAPKELREFLAD